MDLFPFFYCWARRKLFAPRKATTSTTRQRGQLSYLTGVGAKMDPSPPSS